MKREKTKLITSIGGQALIEGIMMRGPQKTSISIRQSNGEIHNEDIDIPLIQNKSKIFKFPLLRGVVGFIDSMRIGYKALTISAEKASEGIQEEEEPSKFDKWIEDKLGDKAMKVFMSISMVIGIAVSLLLFLVFPTWTFNNVSKNFEFLNNSMLYRSVFEGILRVVLFLVYVIICSRQRDMKRVFQYHGAEHKTIFCYECDEELTVSNVKKHVRFHPRCGTSFIFLMIIVGIIVGLFIPFTNPILRTVVKLLCVPIIVGLGYELIKICGKHDNLITRIISAPGLWIQRITTKEPEDDMIEIAISAMKAVIPEDGKDRIEI